jgi:localization factor PodJL
MSAGAPWSVKGIDPKAREVAKDLARRSGMTLGEWLNRVILEDDIPEEVSTEAEFGRRSFQEQPRLRVLTNLPAATPELSRISLALDRITDRIEASETRTGLAISGVEHSVRVALARLEAAEREQIAVATRLDRALDESVALHDRHSERLSRLEEAGPRSPEALRLLEARIARLEQPQAIVEDVLERLGERLALAEARTAAAISALRGSLSELDDRVSGAAPGRFEALAEALSARVEAVRSEVAEQLQAATGEARLAEMTQHIRVAERRSTEAVEELGRQVLTMAEAVSRKLTDVDQRSADAIDQVGSEVARVAGAVEQRLARQEQAQAEGFERLRAEFSISYPKPTQAERPPVATPAPVAPPPAAAAALVAAVPTAPAARHIAAGAGPAAWLTGAVAARAEPVPEPEHEREPEAEAARRLIDSDQPFQFDEEVEQPEWLASAALMGEPPEPEPEAETIAAFGPELFSRAEPEPEPGSETVDAPWRRLDLDVPESDVPDTFAPIPEDEELFETAAPARATGPELSTREVIDRARAAARATQRNRPADLRAKVNRGSASGRLFSGFGARTQRQGSALQTALMVAGGAAFLSVGAAGLTLMQGPGEKREAVQDAPIAPQPRAAVALAPAGFAPAPDVTEPPVPPVFAQVRADVEAGVPGALGRLKALADANHPQAQLYLAQLYDGGEAGLAQSPVEARRLTALAAQNGEVRAMHNLGVYFFRGEGGPQDLTSAAYWFQKAASAGVVESQYNLGLLYQTGNGVPQDLAEARRWFATAAAGGDAQARQALAQLSPNAAASSATSR